MKKDLEQLRLNMIRTLMELDYDTLLQVKDFLEKETSAGFSEHINDQTVEFIDYSKISKIKSQKTEKTSIVFL